MRAFRINSSLVMIKLPQVFDFVVAHLQCEHANVKGRGLIVYSRWTVLGRFLP